MSNILNTMIEKTVLDYLAEKLDVPVFMEVPENVPSKYVLVEKTGGGMENYIFTATFAIQSIASTLAEAAELNVKAINAMLNIVNERDVSRAEYGSDYNFTDTTTKEYRYQAVFYLSF